MSGRRRSLFKTTRGSSLFGQVVLLGVAYSVARDGHVLRTIWLCGCLLDTYRALRTVRPNGRTVGVTTRKKAMREALTSWIVYIVIQNVEPVASQALGLIPFYTPLSTLISFAFLFTRPQSSTQIYTSFVRPLLGRYQTPIDLTVLLFKSIVELAGLYLVMEPLWTCKRIYGTVAKAARSRLWLIEDLDLGEPPLGSDVDIIGMETSLANDDVNDDVEHDGLPSLPQLANQRNYVGTATIASNARPTSSTSPRPETLPSSREGLQEPYMVVTMTQSIPVASSRSAPNPHPIPLSQHTGSQATTSNITIRKPRTLPLDKRKPDSSLALASKPTKVGSSEGFKHAFSTAPLRTGPTIRPTNTVRAKRPFDVLEAEDKRGFVKASAQSTRAPHAPRAGLAPPKADGTRLISFKSSCQSQDAPSGKTDPAASSLARKPSISDISSTTASHRLPFRPASIHPTISPRKRPRELDMGLESKRKRVAITEPQKRDQLGTTVPESKRRRVGLTAPPPTRDRPVVSRAIAERPRMEVYEDR